MRKLVIAAMLCCLPASSAWAQDCAAAAKEVKPVIPAAARKVYEEKLAKAFEDDTREKGSADSTIWLGRRIAYLGNYKDAVRVFASGISKYPQDVRLWRHRGHRYITLRCFDDAVKDLETAAALVDGKPDEVEPDGLPNAKNIPTSTLQSNIWYHLGLAYYLKGDFTNALRAYEAAQKVSTNNDMLAATTHWHYMTLRRLGRKADADRLLEPFRGQFDVIENDDYLKLIRLYRGETRPEALLREIGAGDSLSSSSLGYGVGNWYLYNGDKAKAAEMFRKITRSSQWASFGYIAAEAELRASVQKPARSKGE